MNNSIKKTLEDQTKDQLENIIKNELLECFNLVKKYWIKNIEFFGYSDFLYNYHLNNKKTQR